jgi:hypothetical protein
MTDTLHSETRTETHSETHAETGTGNAVDTNVATTPDRRRRDTVVVVLAAIVTMAVLLAMWVSLRPTNASFSATETVGRNRLGTGTLDIVVGEQTTAFSASNMAAGDRVSGELVLENRGSFPLRYEMSSFSPPSPLRDALEVVAWTSSGPCSATPPSTGTWNVLQLATPGAGRAVSEGAPLAPGDTDLICMSAFLPITASSELQGQRLDLLIGIDAVQDVAGTTGTTGTTTAGGES